MPSILETVDEIFFLDDRGRILIKEAPALFDEKRVARDNPAPTTFGGTACRAYRREHSPRAARLGGLFA
jgi:hypothetical protein